MPFSKLDLSDQLVQGILATGYTAPTAIQSQAIPLAVTGRDIIGVAKTGTGKTAAFILPMLNHLTKQGTHHTTHHARALVLTPTRELALQAEEFITTYGRFTNIQSLTIIGGASMDNQVKRLRHGVDIIIATPGRLNDHLNRHTADLSKIEILVLDEADRMFDMGFINDVRENHRPYAGEAANAVVLCDYVERSESVDCVHSKESIVDRNRRAATACRNRCASVLYRTPGDENRVAPSLARFGGLSIARSFFRGQSTEPTRSRARLERNGVQSVAIHSNRTQAQRQRALAGFKQGHYKVLVATDIAARGIDVEGISHVINYDTPTFAEDYIHRIGRTGRATANGDAITFVSAAEQKFVKSIEKYVGRRYDVKRYEGFDYTKKESLVAETKTMQHDTPHHRHANPSGSKHQGHDGSERNRKPRRYTAHPLKKKKSYSPKESFGKKESFERKESIESRERSWRKLFRREK